MSQNQNRTINQFLQGKSSTVNNYNFSNKNPLQGRLYFSKDINNKKTKVLSPHFDRSNNEYNNEKKNNLLNSYKETNNKNCRNYYKIHSHNHSEYIMNNSTDLFPNSVIAQRDTTKTPEMKKKSFSESCHFKTEDHVISRNNSGNYKINIKEEAKKKSEEKKFNTARQERKSLPFIKLSSSIPILFKDKYELDEKKEKTENNLQNKVFLERTYSKKNKQKNQNNNNNNKSSISDINLSCSINNSDTENKSNQIKNYKSSYIMRNNKNTFENLFNEIKSSKINNKDIDKDKDNYKRHSITVKKSTKIDKNEIRNDYKKEYYNENMINNKKNESIKEINNKKNNKRNSFRIIIDNNNKKKKLTKKKQNHSLFESINIKKINQNEIPEKKKVNNNVNTYLDSYIIINEKKKSNNNSINTSKNSSNNNSRKKIIIQNYDNKNIGKNFIKTQNDFSYISNINETKKKYTKTNNNELYNKKRHSNILYNSCDVSENFKNKSIDISNNNKITYVYEGKYKKPNSLSLDLNNLINEKENDDKLDNDNINLNDNIKKNLGNILQRIIRKGNKKQKIKKIILNDNTIINNKNIEEFLKQSTIKNYCKTESNIVCIKKRRKIKKFDSNHQIEKNQFTIGKKKSFDTQSKSTITKNDENKICKVNDMIFEGEQNNGNNSNIIIIINKTDKNKLKKIIISPKKKPKIISGDDNKIINNIQITNVDNKKKKKKIKIKIKIIIYK